MTDGRIVLLTTTARVAPGLLSYAAWQALHGADRVLCRASAHPQLPYLAEAGVTVETGAPELADAPALIGACAGGRTVVVLAAADGEPDLTRGLALLAGSGRANGMPELELLPGSYDLPGARLLDLVGVMDRIRAVCPWASTRTAADLARYGLEEVYELVEAIETGDRAELREELGDVLLQVVFHAVIARDDPEQPFDIDDVADTIVAKLIRRHPHVFGDEHAETAEDVKALWLREKAAEKRRASVTEGVPLGQPGLALAAKLAARARTAGLDAPLPGGADAPGPAGDFGTRLLALAVEAEAAGVDPEAALRAAARAYREAIRAAERAGGPAGG
ncbi:nucleoside triphosphate pyrophosphohydrolase [Streptomyces marincola]|uniref:nucleoside triphosphate pyrophosphohydrolase n=1 Tax=Streptomyces marincola TaxID=2878388 RepID=UPI001CF24856|nr:nucleoside triphosphate pyrophosphohydrolase [Streptomyces marincola]UCM88514.1 nucleoside triphosphate pyrophosphohydrolase [Streptomyces marincola]